MNPVVGLRLAESKLQTMHLLEWIGFHVHECEQQAVGIRFERTFGLGASLVLAFRTLCRQVRRVQLRIRMLECRQQAVKFRYGQPVAAIKVVGRFLSVA